MSDKNYIKEGLEVFKHGGVVIFPTDTAFGIGCRVDDEEAVKKVFSIRKRPMTQAVPVLVGSLEMAKNYVLSIPEEVEKQLIKNYWPGALTIVLPSQMGKVSSLVGGGGLTLGVRMPNHEVPLRITQMLGFPIIGPSANFNGEPTPYQMADINPQLFSLVDYIIPGVCSVKRESTVVDCTVNPWKILRVGALDLNL